jgi:adenylate kinase family enzyme
MSESGSTMSMKRVALVGSGGAGKTTLAREMAALTGLPLFHLDEIYWHPGWVETPREDWRATQAVLVENDEWIIDGNYFNSYDIRFARADAVIVLALPRRICIARVLWRMLKNWHRDVQARGCPEHFDWEFIRWLWRYPYDVRPGLDEALARHVGQFELIELKTTRQVRHFVDTLHGRS